MHSCYVLLSRLPPSQPLGVCPSTQQNVFPPNFEVEVGELEQEALGVELFLAHTDSDLLEERLLAFSNYFPVTPSSPLPSGTSNKRPKL